MPRIVIAENLGIYPDQIERLKKLGVLTTFSEPLKSSDEWLERCRGHDIICSGKLGLKEKVYDLSDVFISVPFVAVDWIDKKKIKEKNITIANSPGCNKDAVSEWIIGMMINLSRKFPEHMNTKKRLLIEDRDKGLTGKKICILGRGNIGSRVGEICRSFDMDVTHFKRGDDILECIKDSDYVIDCLGSNESTYNILDKRFFGSLKKGSYFVTVTGMKICDYDSMLEALDAGILAGAATDAGGIQVGDTDDPFYRKLVNHERLIVTPHIAYRTDVTARVANDMMIDNIEAWLKGKPINIVN
jgi:phosphoglycerate dehydrogenase-like enzyme